MNYRVANTSDSDYLDNLLNMLIQDEKKYDKNIDSNFKVKDYYKNIIGRDNHKIYLCENNDKIVGYIYAFIKDNNSAKIDALFVDKAYRNKHIASNLINLVFSWLKISNINEVEINVMSENLIAKQLYLKNGFKSFKETLKLEMDNKRSNYY